MYCNENKNYQMAESSSLKKNEIALPRFLKTENARRENGAGRHTASPMGTVGTKVVFSLENAIGEISRADHLLLPDSIADLHKNV